MEYNTFAVDRRVADLFARGQYVPSSNQHTPPEVQPNPQPYSIAELLGLRRSLAYVSCPIHRFKPEAWSEKILLEAVGYQLRTVSRFSPETQQQQQLPPQATQHQQPQPQQQLPPQLPLSSFTDQVQAERRGARTQAEAVFAADIEAARLQELLKDRAPLPTSATTTRQPINPFPGGGFRRDISGRQARQALRPQETVLGAMGTIGTPGERAVERAFSIEQALQQMAISRQRSLAAMDPELSGGFGSLAGIGFHPPPSQSTHGYVPGGALTAVPTIALEIAGWTPTHIPQQQPLTVNSVYNYNPGILKAQQARIPQPPAPVDAYTARLSAQQSRAPVPSQQPQPMDAYTAMLVKNERDRQVAKAKENVATNSLDNQVVNRQPHNSPVSPVRDNGKGKGRAEPSPAPTPAIPIPKASLSPPPSLMG